MTAEMLAASAFREMSLFWPVFAIMIGAAVVVLADAFLPKRHPAVIPALALAALISAAVLWIVYDLTEPSPLLGGALLADRLTRAIGLIIIVAAACTVLLAAPAAAESRLHSGEYYGLILLGASGMMLTAAANDFLTLVVAIEIMAAATYFLAGSIRTLRASESALKYFILGGFSSAFLLMGIALIWGATGDLHFNALGKADVAGIAQQIPALRFIGMALLLVGLGFKVGAAPFHLWVPDVYQGAPTPITALMATGVKAAVIAAIFRVLGHQMLATGETWKLLWACAVLTMILGNVVAIVQSSVKRMLAYSGIAHTGYLLLGLTALARDGQFTRSITHATVTYLAAYTIMTIGAFAVLCLRKTDGKEIETFDDLRGLYRRNPGAAFVMTLCMFSLAGMPPLAGFWAKYLVFLEALKAEFIGLVIVGVLTSVVSLYYYLRVVVVMVLQDDDHAPALERTTASSRLVLALAGLGVVAMGILIEPIQQILF